MKFRASLGKELLEQWRSHRFLATAVVLLVFGLLSPLFAKLSPQLIKMVPQGERFAALIPPPTVADALAQYVKNVSQFGIFLALLMTMGCVAREKERGTAAMILVKPLPRGEFLVAKLTALALTFLASLGLAALGGFYYTMILFKAPPFLPWVALNALTWLCLLVYVSLTLLFSTLFKSQWAAAGLGVGVIFLFSALAAIPVLARYLPSQLIHWGLELCKGSPPSQWPAVAVSLALVVLGFLAAWAIFERQEL